MYNNKSAILDILTTLLLVFGFVIHYIPCFPDPIENGAWKYDFYCQEWQYRDDWDLRIDDSNNIFSEKCDLKPAWLRRLNNQ